ncbi:poliovirus receptor homolog [Polymixia lowei]
MWGSAPALCLLLWIVAMITSRIQGEVTTHASLSAAAGHPFTLSCNVTVGTDDTIRQVRWLNSQSKVLLVYEPGAPARITARQPEVELAASGNDGSSITIKRARPDDEGCYRCIFDVYPGGTQEGKTCLNVTVKVGLDGNRTAVSGKLATLSCRYNVPERVRQVLWRKTAEQGDTTSVASYSKQGLTVEEAFRGRVSLSRSLGDTQLTIQPVRTEDEGCYTCEFHTFPEGTRRATACLSVYVLPKPEVTYVTLSSGVIEANCTTQSRPAAEITWNVMERDNLTLGQTISSAYDQGDGTTLVTSTLLLQSGLLSDLSVKCVVHHQGLEKPITVSLSTNVRPALVILISVCGVAAILLLCLCVCLCKCFICTDD